MYLSLPVIDSVTDQPSLFSNMQFRCGLSVSFLAALANFALCDNSLVNRTFLSGLFSSAVNYNDLQQLLSVSAEVYLPGSGQFESVVSRWSNSNTPKANIVVVPSNEADVQKIVSTASMFGNELCSDMLSPIVTSTDVRDYPDQICQQKFGAISRSQRFPRLDINARKLPRWY